MKENNGKNRILILGNSYLVVYKFRQELIERLIKEGFEVWVCFPNGPFGDGEKKSKELGCHFIENHMERRGTNIIKDYLVIKEYYKIISQVKPKVVLAYTVKPDVYGGIVCKRMKVNFIPNITGLGKGLDEKGIVQKITIFLYKKAMKNSKCVFFQNEMDKKFFDDYKIKYRNCKLIPGSGVNLKKFVPLPFPKDDEPVRFIYVARLMKAKGIEQYLSAAHIIKKEFKQVEFHVCGYCEEDYSKIVKEMQDSGEIIYHGLVDDVIKYELMCHCIVLPSFHPEGVSNVLLEGAANARALITTDKVGCRETVIDGVTGYIVKQKDTQSLVEAMIKFINLPNSVRKNMGMKGREKIEKEYDREIVVDAYLSEINKIFSD